MFSVSQLTGENLSEKTLCLTFDDGPGVSKKGEKGPKTIEIANYLADQKIFATFFMVGKHIIRYPHIVQQVSKLGHLIGNHSCFHSEDFNTLFLKGWDISAEILLTDSLIRVYAMNDKIFFRAPWGIWSEPVANKLNNDTNSEKYIGPFYWDINADDWKCWQDGLSAEACASYYLDKINVVNHGIVLMHDSSADNPHARNQNMTFETIEILIPKLKNLGYTFIRLDEFY
jgi:peptidoglycan/xylan/chitin deacetylase (PgdA/CDA1 family)